MIELEVVIQFAIAPIVAGIGAKVVGNFLGGLFGGGKKRKQEAPELIFQRNMKRFMAQLPKLNQRGLQAQQTQNIDQSLRRRGAQQDRAFSRLLGPNVTSVAQATRGAGDFRDRATLLGQSNRAIEQQGFESELSRFGAAAGAAGGVTGLQNQFQGEREPASRFGRAAGLGFVTAGQGIGDFFKNKALGI